MSIGSSLGLVYLPFTAHSAAMPGLLDNVYVHIPVSEWCRTSLTVRPQYLDNVVGPGSPKYDNAYFEISYVRAYTVPAAPQSTPGASGGSFPASPTDNAAIPGSTSRAETSGVHGSVANLAVLILTSCSVTALLLLGF